MPSITLALAQCNPLVGDIDGNADLILRLVAEARDSLGAQVVVFPELVLTGYPPEDLLLRPGFAERVEVALKRLVRELPAEVWVVLGYPRRRPAGLMNMAGVFHGGELGFEYAKRELPNYQVFDERRYFIPGSADDVPSGALCEIAGLPVALSICEDLWELDRSLEAAAAGAKLIINLNASPFHIGKQAERLDLLRRRAEQTTLPLIYVNLVGGQDELVFDGGSAAVDATGTPCAVAPAFHDCLQAVRLECRDGAVTAVAGELAVWPQEDEEIYAALCCSLRDYASKNRFDGAVVGLSGGVDSALTLAIAADALEPDRIEAVLMPSRHTADISVEDAVAEAEALGVRHHIRPIEPVYQAFLDALAEDFAGTEPNEAEENLQARCRGMLLMAMSNKRSLLVLTTGNKSELAVGYSTLYGDMAGGFCVLKDVPKMRVYRLAQLRNRRSQVIPERVLTRAPSAELRPDQRDDDSLPPYPLLDEILRRYVEGDEGLEEIVAAGFELEQVRHVISLVERNEHKRRQAPVGVRISARAFGRDRRYPITSGWWWRASSRSAEG